MLLNLLIMCLSLINIGGKIEEKQVDLEYVDIALNERRAFTDNDYVSKVNGLSAHQYFDGYASTNFTSSNGFYGYYFSINNQTYGDNFLSTSNYLQFTINNAETNYVNALGSNPDNWVIITCANYTYNGTTKHGFFFRFYYALGTEPKNIEFEVTGSYVSDELYYGYGSFTTGNFDNGSYPSIHWAGGYINLQDDSLMSSNQNVDPYYDARTHNRFFYNWFYLPCTSTSTNARINLSFRALGAFDLDYDEGYRLGYENGRNESTSEAYSQGYTDAINNYGSMDTTAVTIFSGILEVGLLPINVFLSIFNFEVFGINISGLVSGLLTISILIIVLRFLFGGKSDD